MSQSRTEPPVPTSVASKSSVSVDAGGSPESEPKARLGRLGPLLFQAHLGWGIALSSVSSFLVPALVQQIAPSDKVSLFGLLTLVSAFAGLLANIIVGALSDRTRTRWGRRNPFILVGGIFGAACLSAMSLVDDFSVVVLLSVGFTIGFNVMVAPLYAVLPDRVPISRRGTASSIIGFVAVVSQSFGAILAAVFLTTDVRLGIGILPWIFGLASVVFFVFAKDRTTPPDPEPFALRSFIRAFRPPIKRDFMLALFGRLLLNLAYNSVLFYQLYALQDYIKLSAPEVAAVIAASGTIAAVGGALGSVVAGPLSDKLRRRKPIFGVAAGLMALALIPLILEPSVTTFLLFMAVGGLAYGVYQSIDQALMSEVLPSTSDHGKDLGFLNIAHGLPIFLVPTVAAVVLGSGLGYPGLYGLCVIFAVAAGALVLAIRSVR